MTTKHLPKYSSENVEKIYTEWRPSRTKAVERFLAADLCIIFGSRSPEAKWLMEKLSDKKLLIVDDFLPSGQVLGNAKVIHTEEIPPDFVVASTVSSSSVSAVRKKLSERGYAYIQYIDLCYRDSVRFPFPEWILETRGNFMKSPHHWQEIFDALADEESKKILFDVLLYRLTGSDEFMQDYSVRTHEQYWENFLDLGDKEVFLDCGGWDGDTTELFIKQHPQYKKVYLFEPIEENMKRAQKRLAKYENIVFVPKAVSDKAETTYMSLNDAGLSVNDANFGSDCRIDEEGGTERIKTVRIDDVVEERVSFIKMDLEGWEMFALRGAEQTIRKDRPKLAICVYHHAADFYDVYSYISSNIAGGGGEYFLRHYTSGHLETVLFCIPAIQGE